MTNATDSAAALTAHTAFVAAEAYRQAAITPTAVGSLVTATNGRTYRVHVATCAGPNTRRAAPSMAEDLGVVLDSPRAKTLYMALRRRNGNVEIVQSIGRL